MKNGRKLGAKMNGFGAPLRRQKDRQDAQMRLDSAELKLDFFAVLCIGEQWWKLALVSVKNLKKGHEMLAKWQQIASHLPAIRSPHHQTVFVSEFGRRIHSIWIL